MNLCCLLLSENLDFLENWWQGTAEPLRTGGGTVIIVYWRSAAPHDSQSMVTRCLPGAWQQLYEGQGLVKAPLLYRYLDFFQGALLRQWHLPSCHLVGQARTRESSLIPLSSSPTHIQVLTTLSQRYSSQSLHSTSSAAILVQTTILARWTILCCFHWIAPPPPRCSPQSSRVIISRCISL